MVQLNLIPEAVLARRLRRRQLKRWGIALTVSAGVLLVTSVSEWRRRAEAATVSEEVRQLQAQVRVLRKETAELSRQDAHLQLQLERARVLRAKRTWSALLALLTDQLPAGCWFTTIATDPAIPGVAAAPRPAAPPSGAASVQTKTTTPLTIEAPRRLHLTGYAVGASDPHTLVTNLKDSGVFTRVVLGGSRLEQTPNGGYFRFELSCEW